MYIYNIGYFITLGIVVVTLFCTLPLLSYFIFIIVFYFINLSYFTLLMFTL